MDDDKKQKTPIEDFFTDSPKPVGGSFFDEPQESSGKNESSEPMICKIFAGDEGSGASFFDTLEEGEGAERSREAWLPAESTRRALIAAATGAGAAVDGELLTRPALVLEEPLGDPVSQLARHHLGEIVASQRSVPTADSVSNDEKGLCTLIEAECFRAAVNLTGRLLAAYGQAARRRHTPRSVQLWFTRLALLVKIGSYQIAEAEAAPWWNLDRADLYYQFYPETYGGRPGSMVPFHMRLLVATLPAYVKKCAAAVERLYSILAVVDAMLGHLAAGRSEDGSQISLTPAAQRSATRLWQARRTATLQSIANVALMATDYPLAIQILTGLVENADETRKRALVSALGRVYLQVGDVKRAEKCFNQADQKADSSNQDERCRIDRGLLSMAQGNYVEAYQWFSSACESSEGPDGPTPTNPIVANNMAVCLLYGGNLRAAVALLRRAIDAAPARALHEALVINLATLYELDSSRSEANKRALLAAVAAHRGDAFNVTSLKLHSK